MRVNLMKTGTFISQSILVAMLLSITIVSSSTLSSLNAAGDKTHCYDQVGDGHFCFENEKLCEISQKNDEIAESHCYYEN